jgi:hypothetical protein
LRIEYQDWKQTRGMESISQRPRKILKNEWNMQDILYTIKRTNLQIMDIEEVLETKGRDNLFSNITTENFPNLKKESNMQVQKAFKTPR